MKNNNKKIILMLISVLLNAAMLAPMLVFPASADSVQYGDVDLNGKLDALDAVYIQRYSAGLENFTDLQLEISDINNDGSINTLDAVIVLRTSVGLDEVKFYDDPDVGEENLFSDDSSEEFINSVDPAAVEVLRLVNAERAKKGVPPLVLDEKLCTISNIRATEIQEFFDHERPDGTSWWELLSEYDVPYLAAGENIAAGFRSPEAVVNAWMNSEGHRKNIMKSDYKKMGVACVYFENDPYHYYWEQIFTD